MAKHYNPFKMWGAWVGAVIGFLAGWFGMAYGLNFGYMILEEISISLVQGVNAQIWQFVAYGLNSAIGFLVGWGIHSLIRKLR